MGNTLKAAVSAESKIEPVRGRPSKTEIKKKAKSLIVRVTEGEKLLIEKRTRQAGERKVANYMRKSALQIKPQSVRTTEEMQLLLEIKNGLNDIQRLRNLIAKEDRVRLLLDMEVIILKLKKIINHGR